MISAADAQNPTADFHPVIRQWFESRFDGPTEPQQQGWPEIAAGRHTLIAAPTGSGKTLTAFLAVIDRLFKERLAGTLPKNETRVVYVSPLRALSNDMHKNLSQPLFEIAETAITIDAEFDWPEITVGLRTGDTSSSQRTALVKNPPHILVTTPESLFLMLTAENARQKLRSVDTIIIDEIHALVRDKRGSHLALSLERLEAICKKPLQRIGLSATQKPLERVANFLVGDAETRAAVIRRRQPATKDNTNGQRSLFGDVEESVGQAVPDIESGQNVSIVDVGHRRELDLGIEVPPSELSAICSHEQWAEINARIVELINSHRSTLIFVNTRRMAERISHQLTELLGEEAVSSHHGSLAADIRLSTEQRLKTGQLKAVVATASLELGIDVGYIDLVIQLNSPMSIATFLQRIGRSGHALGLTPKGRLVALTRDELVECMALVRAVKAGRLDSVEIRDAPLDVLAQQITAEVAAEEWNTDDLFDLFRSADPYRDVKRSDFDGIIHMLSEGITHNTGRSRVYLHHDQVNRRVRARKSARLVALNNAGAIPEIGSFRVMAEPENVVVGSLDEDFAVESTAGDIFLLGNNSWRLKHLRGGDVIVNDAHGAPPTIPFWRGEAPGRSLEFSEEVSRLREDLEQRIIEAGDDLDQLVPKLAKETGSSNHAAAQIVEYIAAQRAALGVVPTQKRIVFERFFDETGGMQVVVHAPFGGRVTRGWGLAMRKRFCRSFDFELQATADDDGFILSLGPQHSFPLESLFPMLTSQNAYNMLEQAVLYVPTFQLRWRWNVNNALLVHRRNNGKKVPPPLQRFRADDLLTAVFPKLTGCQENITGDHELPDHPLVNQTMEDCLYEAFNLTGLIDVLKRVEAGEIEFIARDTREPSPFSYELLNANPYAFLDGGEAIDRRARAVQTRRSVTVESVDDLGRLEPEAIATVVAEANPPVESADELHDQLLSRFMIPISECRNWSSFVSQLQREGRVTTGCENSREFLIPVERLPVVQAVFPEMIFAETLQIPEGISQEWLTTDARVALVRGFVESSGPVFVSEIVEQIGITDSQCKAALEALEGEGTVMRGRFRSHGNCDVAGDSNQTEWCHRRLLMRIHRLTVQGLRSQIEPVDVVTFVRFLTRHHGVSPGHQRGDANGLFEVIGQLQGIDVQAAAWEEHVLPNRIAGYKSDWLDELCFTGEVGWARLSPPRTDANSKGGNVTRVLPVSLYLRDDIEWLASDALQCERAHLTELARKIHDSLVIKGALFITDLMREHSVTAADITGALCELVSQGVVTADGIAGLRGLIGEESARQRQRQDRLRRQRQKTVSGQTGRWSIRRLAGQDVPDADDEQHTAGQASSGTPTLPNKTDTERQHIEEWAWQLLRRWGVVFRDLLEREQSASRWYQLAQVYRKFEARGEIRGGRFIRGVAGEQFATAETIPLLRQLREQTVENELVTLSAADPLNLIGIITDHARVPATASNRIAFLNGQPIAALQGGKFVALRPMESKIESELRSQWKCPACVAETSLATP